MQQMMQPQKPSNSLLSILTKAEEFVLCLLLMIMIVLACVQILLRTVFSSGLTWVDPLLRYLVLWSGLLGAALATSQGKHIALDIISFLVPKFMKSWLEVITGLFSTTVAAFLTWAAFLFIRSEIQFGNTKLLSIPAWIWNLIFPIAFIVITFRFLMASWKTFMSIISLQKKER
jgi:TRAP-type C4-dicarboxylate transport system permease small subunit